MMPMELTDDFLRFKVYHRSQQQGFPLDDARRERIEYELGVIKEMGFCSYFLIVADLCDFMRRENIMFNVRGSGCGSTCVWRLGISHKWLDPIRFRLPFERFLNPHRVSNPDLDIDIQDDKRHLVTQYTTEKYGADRVSRIITFGTLGARAAIQDTARALNMPGYQDVASTISRAIPLGQGVRLSDCLKTNPFLAEQQQAHPLLFDRAQRVEGFARHASIHAAGVIIAPEPMHHFLPLYFRGDPDGRSPEDNVPTSQWDMYDVEARGLLKMDYLGQKPLRVIKNTVDMINILRVKQGLEPNFSIDNIPQDDQKTWDMLSRGELVGVFQLSKEFIHKFARRMKLHEVKDIMQLAVLVSIIRPGMMDAGTTEVYLRRAEGGEMATPLHPLVEQTLRSTYGLMVFQEDCMLVAQDMAGFSMAEADELRRGIGKKKRRSLTRCGPSLLRALWSVGPPKKMLAMCGSKWRPLLAMASTAHTPPRMRWWRTGPLT